MMRSSHLAIPLSRGHSLLMNLLASIASLIFLALGPRNEGMSQPSEC